MKIYWYGYGGSSHLAEDLRPMIESLGCTLTSIHEWENADIQYNRLTVLKELVKADLIIIPSNWKGQPAKSNNRLTQAFALGKPVVCSPMPSYVDVINSMPEGIVKPAIFAEGPEGWKLAIEFLKGHPEIRESMSKSALEVAKGYSMNAVTNKWVKIFESSHEKTDIIIPNYNNYQYLHECLASIKQFTKNYRIIISDASSDEMTISYLKSINDTNIEIIYSDVRLNFSQACNRGILKSKSKYFVLLNSDTLVSENWLANMIKKMDSVPRLAVCGPLSNCDVGFLNNMEMKVNEELTLHPKMSLEEISKHRENLNEWMLMNSNKYSEHFTFVEQFAYYAVVIARSAIDTIGLLDEGFNSGCEDFDANIRLKKAGYNIGMTWSSFVWHGGSVSRAEYEREDKTTYHIEDEANHNYFRRKWLI